MAVTRNVEICKCSSSPDYDWDKGGVSESGTAEVLNKLAQVQVSF